MFKKTTINIEEKQLEKLDLIASALDIPRNKLICMLIDKCIRERLDNAILLKQKKQELLHFKEQLEKE